MENLFTVVICFQMKKNKSPVNHGKEYVFEIFFNRFINRIIIVMFLSHNIMIYMRKRHKGLTCYVTCPNLRDFGLT